MTIFIDLIGAWTIRISMIAIMLGMTVTMNDALYQSAQQATVKGNVADAAEIISQDLTMAGFNVIGNAFSTIDSNNVWFKGDLNALGSAETINYYTTKDPTTQLYTLYRYVNSENHGTPLMIGSNFVSVKFLYYDYNKVLTTTAANVSSVRVKLVAKIPGVTQALTTSGISSVVCDFRVYPINL